MTFVKQLLSYEFFYVIFKSVFLIQTGIILLFLVQLNYLKIIMVEIKLEHLKKNKLRYKHTTIISIKIQ